MATTNSTDLPEETGHTWDEGQVKAIVVASYVDTGLRLLMVVVIAGLFSWLNYSVMEFVKTAFDADLELLKASPAVARIVTTQVLEALIVATVVQVGVAVVTVFAYLFPKNKGAGGP